MSEGNFYFWFGVICGVLSLGIIYFLVKLIEAKL